MKAYLLAAGYATRMYPLTRDVPKALLEVGDGTILSHIVARLGEIEGLSEIVLVTNARFHPLFRAWADAQESDVPLTVLDDGTTSNETRLGAIGDLAFALARAPLGNEDAIVLASDQLFDADLREVQREFENTGHTTILVRRVEHETGRPTRYNDVVLAEDGRVLRFREKPTDPEGDLAAIALYFFPRGALSLLDDYLADGDHDAPGHFVAWLSGRVPVYAKRLTGTWYDIGSLAGLGRARDRFGHEGTAATD